MGGIATLAANPFSMPLLLDARHTVPNSSDPARRRCLLGDQDDWDAAEETIVLDVVVSTRLGQAMLPITRPICW
jgi:hypothetical protein